MSQNPATNPNTIPQFNYGTLSSLPVAEQNQTYMAYFDGIGGTGPEVIDQTAYFIKYLIDTQGNVVNPEPSFNKDEETALLNLTDNYESGKRAAIKLIGNNPLALTTPNSNCLTGVHPITYVGRIAPILVTETGSGKMDYIATMSFIPPDPPKEAVDNISTLVRLNTSFSASYASWQNITFDEEIYGDNWTFGSTSITLDESTATAKTRIKLKVSLAIASPGGVSIRFRINKNTTVPADNVIVDSGFIPVEAAPRSNPRTYTVESPYIDSALSDIYRVYYDLNITSVGDSPHIIMGNDDGIADTYLLVQQENAPYDPTIGPNYIDGANAIYKSSPASLFKNGYNYVYDYPNANYSYIFWNSGSAQLYNSGKIQTLDPASDAMGFSQITIPFGDTKRGDYIRLEYNKNQVYNIVDVTPISAGSYPTLRMKVTPNIGTISGINTSITSSHFCIYRVINDGTYVVLDVKKENLNSDGESYTGIIQPEFVSTELKGNYDKIITDLTQKNIIS